MTQIQTMYEHETVNVHVKQLEGIVEEAKANMVIEQQNARDKSTTKENQFELSISVPPLEEVNPFGFNYHDIKRNTQKWFDVGIGKVTCSIIGYLVGLVGEEEHLHYLTCIKHKIDPIK